MTYQVRYKLYRKSLRTYTIKVQAENMMAAAEQVARQIWKYPFHIISIFRVGDIHASKATLA